MYKLEVKLKNETGLHARPASMFVKEAGKFNSDIKLYKNEKECNAKSIISVLSIGASKGDQLVIVAEGADEKEAVEALKAMVDSNFGE